MGYEATTIKAIGFYKYKCAVAPIDDGESTNGDNEGTDNIEDAETEDTEKEEGSIFDDEQDKVTDGSQA